MLLRISSASLILTLFGIFLAGVLLTITFCVATDCRGDISALAISSYDECVEAEFPVVASDPPRCIVNEKTVFVRAPRFIRLSSPKPGDSVSSVLRLTGEAKALNNQVHYEITDASGSIIADGSTQSNSPEHGRWGAFDTSVALPETTGVLMLDVFNKTGSGERIDIVSLKLNDNQSEASSSIDSLAGEGSESSILSAPEFDPLADADNNVPTALRLDVPFTPQAPFADWNPPFDEACEEASLLMAYKHAMGDQVTEQQASNELIDMTSWQSDHDYEVDISTSELAGFARQYYDVDTAIYTNESVTVEAIKKLIAAGYPVIIPAAGHLLNNPNFRGAGPPYHMLVITGYTDTTFITNDPGTKRGEDYEYGQDTIMNAIHDWNGSKDTIQSGPKAMMVIGK